MSNIHNFDYQIKYILIGDTAVGKSNILLRFMQNSFFEGYKATIGVEFGEKNLKLDYLNFKLQIWDTSGQETYQSITRSYYRNAACAVIVYDVTNKNSYLNVQSWIKECWENSSGYALLVLVGNKIDLEENRVIMRGEAEEFARENKMIYIETSAKTGENVEKVFMESLKKIENNIINGYYDFWTDFAGVVKQDTGRKLKKKENKKKGYCC